MSRLIPVDADEYRKDVKHDIENESSHVLDGKCANFEEYKKRTGIITGLKKALDHFAGALNKDDDDGPE